MYACMLLLEEVKFVFKPVSFLHTFVSLFCPPSIKLLPCVIIARREDKRSKVMNSFGPSQTFAHNDKACLMLCSHIMFNSVEFYKAAMYWVALILSIF